MNTLIEETNNALSDLPITYSWKGHGYAIFIEIGKLDLVKRKNHPKGEYSVMLDCEWRIENDNSIECGSFCESDVIEETLLTLTGDNVSHIETIGILHELVIVLKSGRRVVSFTSDIGDPEWCIFLPGRKTLGSKNGVVVCENA